MAPVAWIANFQSWCSWIIQEPQASLTLPLVSIGSFSTKRGNHSVLFTSTYSTRELKFPNRSIKTCKVILITLGVPLCYSVVYHIHLEMSIWDDKWRFIRVHDMKGAARYDLSLDSRPATAKRKTSENENSLLLFLPLPSENATRMIWWLIFFMFDIAYLCYCAIDWRWLFKRLSFLSYRDWHFFSIVIRQVFLCCRIVESWRNIPKPLFRLFSVLVKARMDISF